MILKRLSLSTWLALFVTFVVVSGASAAKLPDEKFWFRFEGFLAPGLQHDTVLQIDSETLGTGTEINFEDDLGFDTEVVSLKGDFVYRLGKRHRLSFAFNWVNRNSTHVLEREIQVGDDIYTVGANLEGTMDTQDYDLNYGYSFVRNDVAEVGASIGLHVLAVDTTFSAQLGGGQGVQTESDASVTAPLPVIGLYGRGALSNRFFLTGGAQLFAISIEDKFSGHYFDLQGGLEFLVVNHFIIGAGYAWNEMNIEVDRGDELISFGMIELTRQGPVLALKFFW